MSSPTEECVSFTSDELHIGIRREREYPGGESLTPAYR